MREEAPHYATLLPQIPRLLHQRLHEKNTRAELDGIMQQLLVQQKRRNTLLMVIALILLLQMVWELSR